MANAAFIFKGYFGCILAMTPTCETCVSLTYSSVFYSLHDNLIQIFCACLTENQSSSYLIFPSCVLLGIFTSTIQGSRISEFYMYKTPWMLMPKFFLIQISFLMMALWPYEVSETAVPAE